MARRADAQKKKTDIELIAEFWAAPPEALFDQESLVPVVRKSAKWFEHKRYVGGGIPYLKQDRHCLYRKASVLHWLEEHSQEVRSTSEYPQSCCVA
jgi:hypothetical protein